MSGVHQFVPMLHVGDAVGRHTAAVQSLLAVRGIRSEVYVELVDPETADRTRLAGDYEREAEPGDIVVYQFATASDLAEVLATRSETLIVNYHNVTPPDLFAPWDNTLARHQVRAMAELDLLSTRAALGVAVSEWNRQDLVAARYAATAVVPPVVTVPRPSRTSREPWAGGGRWLSVGRLAPNKAVEDVLAALVVARTDDDPCAQLTVVGRPALAAYARALAAYAAELGIADAVTFSGHVDEAGLEAAYGAADVVVVASEHEGFCLPAVEAMARGVPVVAYREGALPEVLGDAGVLVDDKSPATIAAAVRALRDDPARREALVAAGRARVGALGLDRAGSDLVDLCVAALEGATWPASVSPREPDSSLG